MGNQKETSRLRVGLSAGIFYLIVDAAMSWRDFPLSDWKLASINAGAVIVESMLFGLLFAWVFPPALRFVARRIPHKRVQQ